MPVLTRSNVELYLDFHYYFLTHMQYVSPVKIRAYNHSFLAFREYKKRVYWQLTENIGPKMVGSIVKGIRKREVTFLHTLLVHNAYCGIKPLLLFLVLTARCLLCRPVLSRTVPVFSIEHNNNYYDQNCTIIRKQGP